MKASYWIIVSLSCSSFLYSSLPPVGLQNCGNSCYMNSLIQALYNIPQLTQFLSTYHNSYQPDSLAQHYHKVTKLIQDAQQKQLTTKTPIVIPSSSLQGFFDSAGMAIAGESGHQEDVQQFWQTLIDNCVDTGLLPTIAKIDKNTITTFFSHLFGCTIASHISLVSTTKNEPPLIKEEQLYMLSLPLAKPLTSKQTQLTDCLNAFFAPELIDAHSANKFLWPTTKTYEDVIKQLVLNSNPEMLVIHLKRFEWNKATAKAIKLIDNVAFPFDNLNIRPYMAPLAPPNTTYELEAIVIHEGRNAGGGHYTAYIKVMSSAGPIWYHCNDKVINVIDNKTMVLFEKQGYISYPRNPKISKKQQEINEKSFSPYLLFYRRKDVKKPFVLNDNHKQTLINFTHTLKGLLTQYSS